MKHESLFTLTALKLIKSHSIPLETELIIVQMGRPARELKSNQGRRKAGHQNTIVSEQAGSEKSSYNSMFRSTPRLQDCRLHLPAPH